MQEIKGGFVQGMEDAKYREDLMICMAASSSRARGWKGGWEGS
jgi:hypothetical protein